MVNRGDDRRGGLASLLWSRRVTNQCFPRHDAMMESNRMDALCDVGENVQRGAVKMRRGVVCHVSVAGSLLPRFREPPPDRPTQSGGSAVWGRVGENHEKLGRDVRKRRNMWLASSTQIGGCASKAQIFSWQHQHLPPLQDPDIKRDTICHGPRVSPCISPSTKETQPARGITQLTLLYTTDFLKTHRG